MIYVFDLCALKKAFNLCMLSVSTLQSITRPILPKELLSNSTLGLRCKGESSYSLLGAICGDDNVIADALIIQRDSTSE
jgi:hypothetical protein